MDTKQNRRNRIKYKQKVKAKKQEIIKSWVARIKAANTVVNLSKEDIPDAAYKFQSKGLGYVPSQKLNSQNLKYDITEFIWKLEWRTFFTANPEIDSANGPPGDLHKVEYLASHTLILQHLN